MYCCGNKKVKGYVCYHVNLKTVKGLDNQGCATSFLVVPARMTYLFVTSLLASCLLVLPSAHWITWFFRKFRQLIKLKNL